MPSFTTRAAALAALILGASALDGIVTPPNITAGEPFDITFKGANDNTYRVYLAAALAGVNGPTCYLLNSTTLTSPLTNLSIPASVGPSASYYSIAIADLTTSQGATYSNRFTLSNTTGSYSDYENSLSGSPFWSPDQLPCTAYACARNCAMDSYPEDLKEQEAFETMKECILECPGVSEGEGEDGDLEGPALASSGSGGDGDEASATESAEGSQTSESSAARKQSVMFAGAAAAGFGALAFVL
ncbi:hypothetical protein CBER1_06573 [Cercospora berteroae]|uniref:WSC domain-containing protein n=1 Tax=Cercospora berteroae TaxID=357750 RepID=A0A2S6C3H9_9PEZI|nr:hypothetical protein CBER1_06573 [Cercospora berteroae]